MTFSADVHLANRHLNQHIFEPIFIERWVSYSLCIIKMSYRGRLPLQKKMSHSGKVRAQACHLTKKVNKAEQLNQGGKYHHSTIDLLLFDWFGV
jgi:hypothetical protein